MFRRNWGLRSSIFLSYEIGLYGCEWDEQDGRYVEAGTPYEAMGGVVACLILRSYRDIQSASCLNNADLL